MSPIARVLARCDAEPDRVALRDDLGVTLTYGALAQRVRACAAALNAELGAAPQVVALAAGNHAAHVVAMLAIFLAGHAWFPVNPRAARAQNDRMNKKIAPGLLLLDEGCASCVSSLAQTLRFNGADLDSLPTVPADEGRFPIGGEDAAMAIKLTGGTTGEPKAVVQTQRVLSTVMADLDRVFAFSETDVNLAVAPLSHGAFHLLLPVLVAGGRHEIVSGGGPDLLLDLMADREVSLAFMPPTLITKLMARPGARPDRFTALRELIYSAAPMPPAQIERARQAFGPCIAVMYGQVEAPVAIAAMSAEDMNARDRLESCGRVCPSNEVRIIDPDGEGTGEIAVRGPLTVRGYLTGEPSPLDAEGWLRTGDLGRIDPDGFLFIRGRSREVILSGGFNVYPAEVERVLLALPGVEQACVFGAPDPYWGERVEAALVLSAPVDDAMFDAAVRAAIGPVAAPKRIHRVDALPTNPVGKVVRRVVAEAFTQTDEA